MLYKRQVFSRQRQLYQFISTNGFHWPSMFSKNAPENTIPPPLLHYLTGERNCWNNGFIGNISVRVNMLFQTNLTDFRISGTFKVMALIYRSRGKPYIRCINKTELIFHVLSGFITTSPFFSSLLCSCILAIKFQTIQQKIGSLSIRMR